MLYLLLFPTLQACEPAARMALNDVNSNPTLLPGYQLKLHWNDSGVSVSCCEQMNPDRGLGGYFHSLLSCLIPKL